MPPATRTYTHTRLYNRVYCHTHRVRVKCGTLYCPLRRVVHDIAYVRTMCRVRRGSTVAVYTFIPTAPVGMRVDFIRFHFFFFFFFVPARTIVVQLFIRILFFFSFLFSFLRRTRSPCVLCARTLYIISYVRVGRGVVRSYTTCRYIVNTRFGNPLYKYAVRI